MRDYSLCHLSDTVLVRDLTTVIRQERVAIADVLAHIAEVDARKLFAPAGYSSMFVYCVAELHFSEDAASKRIQAARAARQYPVLFTALADGRLHLTAVCLLAPHLTPETVEELVVGASYRRKSEIEDLLAARYRLSPLPPRTSTAQCELPPAHMAGLTEHAPAHVDESPVAPEHALAHVEGSQSVPQDAPGFVSPSPHAPAHAPVSDPFCQITVRQSTRERLRYAQALLSHAMPSGDLSDVLDRALNLLIATTQKRRFGVGSRPAGRRQGGQTRYIPADVRFAVWERDQHRCTFVGTNGHRCHSSRFLELDHVDPRRKENTVEGLRLRCRTHNQLEAERVFGTEFMARKREEARRAAENARAQADADCTTKDQIRDVIAGLRNLGLRSSDAKRAAESTLTMNGPTLEDRMRAALSYITPRRQPLVRSVPPPTTSARKTSRVGEHAPEHVGVSQ